MLPSSCSEPTKVREIWTVLSRKRKTFDAWPTPMAEGTSRGIFSGRAISTSTNAKKPRRVGICLHRQGSMFSTTPFFDRLLRLQLVELFRLLDLHVTNP